AHPNAPMRRRSTAIQQTVPSLRADDCSWHAETRAKRLGIDDGSPDVPHACALKITMHIRSSIFGTPLAVPEHEGAPWRSIDVHASSPRASAPVALSGSS